MEKAFFIGNSPKGISTALPDNKAGGRELSARILTAIAAANESLEQATGKLIRLAEIAVSQRDYPALAELASALQAIPFAPGQRAGKYYQAVTLRRAGQVDTAAAMLSAIPSPRALNSLGTIEQVKGNFG